MAASVPFSTRTVPPGFLWRAAAIYRFQVFGDHEDREVPAYGLLASVFMSAFSIFPALVLQSVADDLRGHWLRQILWLVIFVFTIIVGAIYLQTNFLNIDTSVLVNNVKAPHTVS